MAKVLRKGFFGYEESFKVSGSFAAASSLGDLVWTPGFTWIPGQCFKLDPTDPTYVILCDTAGEQILGIAMDKPTELAQPPAAEKVTILHLPSVVTIDHTAEVSAGTTGAAYLAYEKASVEAAAPMDLLYTNASGKLSTTASGSAQRPAGFVVQVPAAANSYNLVFVLF